MTRRICSQILFYVMGFHSFSSAFLLPADLRTITFLGFADLYFALFLLINAEPRNGHIQDDRGGLLLFVIFLVLSGLVSVAYARFSLFYAVVEFRPYFEAIILFSLMNIMGLRINLDWIPGVFGPFFLIETLFIIANYVLGSHKVGIFGEMNYDAQFVVLAVALARRQITHRHLFYGLIAKTKTFLAYAASLWLLRRPSLIFIAAIIGGLAAGMLVKNIDFSLLKELDRIQIATVLLTIVTEKYSDIVLCGQLFCGDLFYEPALGWYIETQSLASSLQSVVPAVFHGHILRTIFLVGLPLSILAYAFLFMRIKRHDGSWVLLGWLVLTGISQSVFHHPFVGLALVFTVVYFLQRDLDAAKN